MFIEKLAGKIRNWDEKILKKNFKFFLQVYKRSFSFAPALRNKRRIKEIHVRRHIELTAVLIERLGQKNKSNRIVRFEKNR